MFPQRFSGSNRVSRREIGATAVAVLQRSERSSGEIEIMSLGVNADGNNNSKDNRCFYDVDPQCTLRESQNNIRCRHNFTH